MTWPSVYTYNFCSNPSLQQDLTGISAVNGAAVLQDPTLWRTGTYSLRVTTPGVVSGEGVTLPPGTVLGSATGAVSFYLQANTPTSSGTLNVVVNDTTTSTVLGTAIVTFDNTTSWQRVQVLGLSLVNADVISVTVSTSSIQATAFNIDNIQYEPTLTLNGGALPTPYIDGDQPFGVWVGTAEESASTKAFQYMLGATGDIRTSGYGKILATQVIGGHLTNLGTQPTLVFTDPASGPTQILGQIDLSGKKSTGIHNIYFGGGSVSLTGITITLMYAGLNDFSVFSPGDVDPAISLVGYNNAGVSSGTNTSGSAGYTRPYATISAPVAFTGSTSKNIWNTAAYFAIGYQFASVANGVAQNITHVQAELAPAGVPTQGNFTTSPVFASPSSYVRARALTATLAPTVMNYVTNPSFETDTAGWNIIGAGTTITRTGGGGVFGAWFAAVVGTVTHPGAYIVVPNLIVGETYTASGYIYPTANVTSMTIGINPSSTYTSPASATFALPAGVVTRVEVQFVAPTSNVTLGFWGTGSGTQNFSLDGVMLNPGGLVAYGDGSFTGWNWEGTVNDSRSYYYQRGNVAYAAIQNILAQHIPLGIHAYQPVYDTPVTQYN